MDFQIDFACPCTLKIKYNSTTSDTTWHKLWSTLIQQDINVIDNRYLRFSDSSRCVLTNSVCSMIRVWDYSQESCYQVLRGHEGPVRGIMWNSEIPYLLVSGSWDYKIRIWDIRDGACVETLLDHGADVYGQGPHSTLIYKSTLFLFSQILL